jgi:hypothetical protein
VHQRHYDILILGDSLAARLAGSLLAKAGKRLLTFSGRPQPLTPWLFNSIFMSQILDLLGGRHCLIAAPKLQIITGQTRLELHGRQPLEEELRREFPSCHTQLFTLLQWLKAQGEALENQLWKCGGPPLFDFIGGLRFRKRLLLNRINHRTLRQPLPRYLHGINNQEAHIWLDTLFSGLAQQPVENLTLAEGALLWNNISQPRAIAESSFNDLLTQRYKQFHGLSERLTAIESIDHNRKVHLKKTRTCSAEVLLVANATALDFLSASENPGVRRLPAPQRWRTSPFRIGPSSILAAKIILGGNPVLRLTLSPTPSGTICTVETHRSGNVHRPTEAEIKARLSVILPFASFKVATIEEKPIPLDNNASWTATGAFPGKSQRIKLKKNLFLCSGTEAVPHLESSGDIMTGVAVTKYLLGTP